MSIYGFPFRNGFRSQEQPNKPMQSFNIPSLPLLGQLTPSQTLDRLAQTILDEATAIDFYTRLLAGATTGLQREFVGEALAEEKSHLRAFTSLYEFLSGNMPQYTIEPVVFTSFKEGVLKALKDELDAADFYKRMTLSTSDELVRQTYAFAMGDEQEHAVMFSVLLAE